MCLPPNVDFLAADFTDAPDNLAMSRRFHWLEQPVSDTFVVPDLFGYALETVVKQEPDVADMSVDDILDLRAGNLPPRSALPPCASVSGEGRMPPHTFPPQKTTTADGLAADSAAGRR